MPDGSRFEVDMDCEEEAFAGTIRPDDICLAEQGQQENVLTGVVGVRTFLGKSYQYEVNTAAGVLKVNMDTSNLFRDCLLYTSRSSPGHPGASALPG